MPDPDPPGARRATGPYAAVLRRPGVARLAGAALLGRLPGGMAVLSIILVVRAETGSFGLAGAVAGVHAAGAAIGQPLQGRLIDRHGEARVLVPAALVFTVSYGGFAFASAGPLLLALGIVSGLAFPALASGLRVLWPTLLADHPDRLRTSGGADQPVASAGAGGGRESGAAVVAGGGRESGAAVVAAESAQLQTAYAVDATVQQLTLVGGPLLVSVLLAFGPRELLVAGTVAFALVGTLAFATSPVARGWRAEPVERHWAGALRSPGVRVLALASVLVGGSYGCLQVGVTAFAEDRGETGATGTLFACWSAASLVAGLAYGAREWSPHATRRLIALGVLLAAGAAAPLLAGSLPAMAVCLAVAGAAFAPWIATGSVVVDRIAPPGAVTEAFAWLVTGLVSGTAAGATVAGQVIEAEGTAAALAFAPAWALTAAATLAAGRRRLA